MNNRLHCYEQWMEEMAIEGDLVTTYEQWLDEYLKTHPNITKEEALQDRILFIREYKNQQL